MGNWVSAGELGQVKEVQRHFFIARLELDLHVSNVLHMYSKSGSIDACQVL